ncbi:MAG: hypothetical protein NC341_03580 [Blautia sp.]|nr:hypothetical protein [Blautia sp.]MCM1200678.1 hypothetical protein [Bacteroides fragilis]
MNHIEYSALNYYHSPVSDECLCLGILFHNITTGQRDFRYISNFKRFQMFDDEADVNFVKAYLAGIKEDIENSVLNYHKSFELQSYIKVFANEFRFSTIKRLQVDEREDYIENLTKIYLKYDLAKAQRLNNNEEKKLIRRVLETNHLAYTNGRIFGEFNDEIPFDYQLDKLCIKHFSFKGKNLRRIISSARQWSFAAGEMAGVKKVLFIYDSDFEDRDNLRIIINILSKHAEVLQMDKGMDYILNLCS